MLNIILYHFILSYIISLPISLSNIPPNLQILKSYDDIISSLANTTNPQCKGAVLFNPQSSMYYFKNPTLSQPSNINSYLKMHCRKMQYSFQSSPRIQRFYFPFHDIEGILNSNDDSIFQIGVKEITDIQKGIEMSIFPVKFYKKENHPYTNNYSFLCYDSIKVLGIDQNYNDYFLINAKNIYDIIHCDSYDAQRGGYYINNLIRYSGYCDEFCREDFIYFSNDLIKCKCDFGNTQSNMISSVDVKINRKNINAIYDEKMSQMLFDFSTLFNVIMMIFAMQILYLFFFFENKKYFFTKISIFFYQIVILTFISVNYLYHITHFSFSFDTFSFISKYFINIYPFIIISYSIIAQRKEQINVIAVTLFINSFHYVFVFDCSIDFLFNVLGLIGIYFFIRNYANKIKIKNYVKIYIVYSKIKISIDLISNLSLICIENNLLSNFFSGVFILISNPISHMNLHISSNETFFKENLYSLISFFERKNISFSNNTIINIINVKNYNQLFFLFNIIRFELIIYMIFIYQTSNTGVLDVINSIVNLDFFRIINNFIQITYLIIFKKTKIIWSNLLFSLFIIHNVLIVKESFVLFLIHLVLGFIIELLRNDNENKGMIRRVFSSSTNLRRDNGINGIAQEELIF